jgi:hypothetical protein
MWFTASWCFDDVLDLMVGSDVLLVRKGRQAPMIQFL